MRALKTFILLSVVPALLWACAATQTEPVPLEEKLANRGYVIGAPVKRIRDWNLNGWSYVDDRHFIMNSGVRDRYLVTLRSSSHELRGAVNIAFTTTVSSLSDTDRVLVRGPGGRMPETLMIESLHKLEPAAKQSGSE